jgi:hypothetical protein
MKEGASTMAKKTAAEYVDEVLKAIEVAAIVRLGESVTEAATRLLDGKIVVGIDDASVRAIAASRAPARADDDVGAVMTLMRGPDVHAFKRV